MIFSYRSVSHDKPPRLYIHARLGLPSAGPFAIKLLAWLELVGIPYEQVIKDNPRKGPKGKNPWMELDGEPTGDTEHIIELLSKRYGVGSDAGLSSEQRAIGLAWRRTFEEHFHQVLEWELSCIRRAWLICYARNDAVEHAGRDRTARFLDAAFHLRKQLHARGLARHTPDIIVAKGRADIEALAAFLGDKPFLLGSEPSTADTSVFGLVAPMMFWPMKTPVASYAKSVGTVSRYCQRMRERCFRSNRVVPKPAFNSA